MSDFVGRLRFGSDHRWAPRQMSAFLDGELAPNGRRRMDRHVGECDECRRLLSGLRQIVEALHRLPARPVGGVDGLVLAASVRLRLTHPPES